MYKHYLPVSSDYLLEACPISQVEQRWFVGAHSNVGGGLDNDLLAQLPLRWLAGKATEQQLAFKREIELDPGISACPIEDSFSDFADGIYKLVKLGKPFYREIGAAPYLSSDQKSRIHIINETIDLSVFNRYRDTLGKETENQYLPSNLLSWQKKTGIDLKTVATSVRADNPRVTVP